MRKREVDAPYFLHVVVFPQEPFLNMASRSKNDLGLVNHASDSSVNIITRKKVQNEPVTFNLNIYNELNVQICSKLISGIIQHILYHREQMPEPFEQLLKVTTTSTFTPSKVKDVSFRVREVKRDQFMKTFVRLFENLDRILAAVDTNKVRRIALLLGPTLITPKEIHCIELPEVVVARARSQSQLKVLVSSERCMVQLFRTLFITHQNFSWPVIKPTNIMVLAEMKRNCGEDWFLPRDFYTLPRRGYQVIYNLIPSRLSTDECSTREIIGCSQHQVTASGDTNAKQEFTVYESPHWSATSATIKGQSSSVGEYVVTAERKMEEKHVDEHIQASRDEFIWYQMPVTPKGIV